MGRGIGHGLAAAAALAVAVGASLAGALPGMAATPDAAAWPAARAAGKLPALRVIPETAHGARSVKITAAGGRVQVKTPSGATVTLAVPAGAIQAGTKVTMTPLSGVKALPFTGGVAAAVQLAPEGLVLARPARLSFHPSTAVRLSLQTAFAATGDGHSFHIYPGRSGRTMTAPVLHFSVYGEGKDGAAERTSEATRTQTSPGAAVERDQAASASDARVAADLLPLAKAADLEVDGAMSDVSQVGVAVDTVLTLAEELRLVGWSSDVLALGDDLPSSAASTLGPVLKHLRANFPTKLLDRALAQTLDTCRTEQTAASRDDVLSVLELRRFLGVDATLDIGLLDQCFGYELVYTHTSVGSPSYAYDRSNATYTDTGTFSENRDVELSASVPLTLDTNGTTYSGSGDLGFTAGTWSSLDQNHNNEPLAYPYFCDATVTDTMTSTTPGTLTVSGLSLGDTVQGVVKLAGVTDSWHDDWNVTSGPCGSVVEDDVESNVLGSIGFEHTNAGDPVSRTYDTTTGNLASLTIGLTTGWVPGTAQPGTTGLVASRTTTGSETDLHGTDDIPFTDKYEIFKTTR